MLNDPHVIGRNIKKLRLAFGETQAELGQATGYTNTAISNLEKGERSNAGMIAAIARHYSVPAALLGYDNLVIDDVAKDGAFVKRVIGAFDTALSFVDDDMPADSEFGKAYTGLVAARDEYSRTGTLPFARDKVLDSFKRFIPYVEGKHGSAAMANIAMGYVLLWMAAPSGAANAIMGRVDARRDMGSKDYVKLALKANDQGRTGNADPARRAFSEEFDEDVFDLLSDVREDPEWADWADFYAALLYLIGFADSGLDDDMQGVVGMHMILTQARLGNRHSVEFLDKYYL